MDFFLNSCFLETDKDDDENSSPRKPKKARTNLNQVVFDMVQNKRDEKTRELDLEERRLALQERQMALEEKRVAVREAELKAQGMWNQPVGGAQQYPFAAPQFPQFPPTAPKQQFPQFRPSSSQQLPLSPMPAQAQSMLAPHQLSPKAGYSRPAARRFIAPTSTVTSQQMLQSRSTQSPGRINLSFDDSMETELGFDDI